MAGDTIVVDLDRNSVIFGEMALEIPPMPPRKWNKLKTTLAETVGHVFWRARGLEKEYQTLTNQHRKTKKIMETLRQKTSSSGGRWVEKLAGLDHAFNLAYTPDSPNLLNDTLPEDERNMWIRVQEGFLRFFVASLKDYRKFLRIPEMTNATGGNSAPTEKPSFDRVGFIAAQKVDGAPFLVEMCMTQQFDDFMTRRMYSPREPDLVFFDQSIDAKLNRSKLKLRKLETPFLQSAKAHKDLTKFKALEPSGDGLEETDFERQLRPYVYKKWPDRFDEDLFCRPRPIPKMIAAEFDRQALLVSKLRASIEDKDEEDDILEFYGGDCDTSPEVASFTVFFFVYSELVGREWQEYQKKRRIEDPTRVSAPQAEPRSKGSQEEREGVAEEIETVLSPLELSKMEQLEAADGCLADLSMGVCDACPEDGLFTLKSAIIFCGEGAHDVYTAMFKDAADEVAELQLQLSATEDGAVGMPDAEEAIVEYEEAREISTAQLDLAFETLSTMSLRYLSVDSDAYLSLMHACGRCGDTPRALNLIDLMKQDGFVADGEVLSCFVSAFAHHDANGVDIGSPITASPSSNRDHSDGHDAYSTFLRKQFEEIKGVHSGALHDSRGTAQCSPSCFQPGEETSLESDEATRTSSDWSGKTPTGGVAFLDWFLHHQFSDGHKKERRRKRRKRSLAGMPVTDMVLRQLTLGETLLEFLYPELEIDTNNDSCPQCSNVLSENDVVEGWSPCAFQDYTTMCPKCRHRFVPRFVVTTSSPTFVGSQGRRTPLYCEFLSPWVVRKELQHVIKGDVGIEGMLKPSWRNGTGIEATLFWNQMVLFRRYRLPFTFLLQGSFQKSRLILPRKPSEV